MVATALGKETISSSQIIASPEITKQEMQRAIQAVQFVGLHVKEIVEKAKIGGVGLHSIEATTQITYLLNVLMLHVKCIQGVEKEMASMAHIQATLIGLQKDGSLFLGEVSHMLDHAITEAVRHPARSIALLMLLFGVVSCTAQPVPASPPPAATAPVGDPPPPVPPTMTGEEAFREATKLSYTPTPIPAETPIPTETPAPFSVEFKNIGDTRIFRVLPGPDFPELLHIINTELQQAGVEVSQSDQYTILAQYARDTQADFANRVDFDDDTGEEINHRVEMGRYAILQLNDVIFGFSQMEDVPYELQKYFVPQEIEGRGTVYVLHLPVGTDLQTLLNAYFQTVLTEEIAEIIAVLNNRRDLDDQILTQEEAIALFDRILAEQKQFFLLIQQIPAQVLLDEYDAVRQREGLPALTPERRASRLKIYREWGFP